MTVRLAPLSLEGARKGRLDSSSAGPGLGPQLEYFSCQGGLSSALKAFQWTAQGPPRLSRMIFLTGSQLRVAFNHIYRNTFPATPR